MKRRFRLGLPYWQPSNDSLASWQNLAVTITSLAQGSLAPVTILFFLNVSHDIHMKYRDLFRERLNAREMFLIIFTQYFLAVSLLCKTASSNPPHIVLTVIDDLGWSDVGFQGSVIRTPNINRLAAEGVILENYYVQPLCTPTRSTLMTGRYPIHTGLQHFVIEPPEPYGMPLNFKTLAQTLKEAGYTTHIVGKWHLGFFEWAYTPTFRGFDSHYGFYTGCGDHYTHERLGILDLRNNTSPVRDMNGTYSANLFTERAEIIIEEHDRSKPLFLYLPFQNVHFPGQAPQKYIDKYSFIDDKQRRTYAAMLDIVDEAIGNVTSSLKKAGLWQNTLFIFTTDNGGLPESGGYNWPLRGQKKTLWEGGVRGVAFVHGTMLGRKGVKVKELLHSTDWYPTLINLAGGKVDNTPVPVDGFDVWETISLGKSSPRKEILLNIDVKEDVKNREKNSDPFYQGAAIRVGDMKLLVSCPNSTWLKPPELRKDGAIYDTTLHDEDLIKIALYNITADPTEHIDLSQKFPDIVRILQGRLEFYQSTSVPPSNQPADSKAWDMARKNGIWTPWRSQQDKPTSLGV
ncbi:arylsulfatase B-like isoform X2 [Montipora foliosa]|uniref:arylsulfatase B-like isoform X2 n=1 Tax=Montipora foliosa TaxID=591990 RepID=UPI0035F184A5